MDRFDYGAFLFFDATYGEFSFIFQGGNNSYDETMDYNGNRVTDLYPGNGTGTELSLGFSLMGKYPFTINKNFTWFPLVGIEYQIALLEWRKPDGARVEDRTNGNLPADRDKDDNTYPLSAWNSLWINVGAGVDYALSGPLFLRGELIFGFRLMTPYEKGAMEMTKDMFNSTEPKNSGLTGSPRLRLALGYKFK
jgi:hypothetical protein